MIEPLVWRIGAYAACQHFQNRSMKQGEQNAFCW
jgi:hypothetical protein